MQQLQKVKPQKRKDTKLKTKGERVTKPALVTEHADNGMGEWTLMTCNKHGQKGSVAVRKTRAAKFAMSI